MIPFSEMLTLENIGGAMLVIIGAYMIFLVFMIDTRGFKATLIYKFIPFMLGISAMGVGGKLLGVL